jgi:hypothetical protein
MLSSLWMASRNASKLFILTPYPVTAGEANPGPRKISHPIKCRAATGVTPEVSIDISCSETNQRDVNSGT